MAYVVVKGVVFPVRNRNDYVEAIAYKNDR